MSNIILCAWPGTLWRSISLWRSSLFRSLDNSLALQFELYLEYSIKLWNDIPKSSFSTNLKVHINLKFCYVQKDTFGFSSLFDHFPVFLVFFAKVGNIIIHIRKLKYLLIRYILIISEKKFSGIKCLGDDLRRTNFDIRRLIYSGFLVLKWCTTQQIFHKSRSCYQPPILACPKSYLWF